MAWAEACITRATPKAPISGLGDAAGWEQGGADVQVRVGNDSLSVEFPSMVPSPIQPTGVTAPPLTMDAAKQDSLTIMKLLLAAAY